ncbi:hypothetical protein [Streptomyces resistomycificus]|uniref:Lipoprotein n=1 Tax=Streptomyces resistomycificus TaxID=67356 RepID=A0A0L8LZV8_9ACTN|nr:hypothetical protein [Streptomyces resistomycificus]KOG43624.1 lipoprotein [Streptomyces resistomycificus]KUO00196.1 hypothetical protein AQJ84_08730 [Streptomyces resistomycificus]
MLQQSFRGPAERTPATERLARGAALTGGLALLALSAACGSAGEGAAPQGAKERASVTAAPAVGVVAPAKVEVIANLTGCKAEIRIDADELREGLCRTKEAKYVITTFPEEKYKETWLDAAAVYGGQYLVGPRWAIGAKPEVLEELRPKVGGTVRQLRAVGPPPSAS